MIGLCFCGHSRENVGFKFDLGVDFGFIGSTRLDGVCIDNFMGFLLSVPSIYNVFTL